MKVIFRHIIIWTLAAFFLVSFTGFRLLVHHCLSCDTTDVFLAQMPQGSDCCHGLHDNGSHLHCEVESNGESSCCPAPAGMPDAEDGIFLLSYLGCETDIHYLKHEYRITTEHTQERISPVELSVNWLQSTDHVNDIHGFTLLNSSFVNHPPPVPVGKDFVVFAHQLKIC